MLFLDFSDFAEMAYKITNTEENKSEKGMSLAGLETEIVEMGRDLLTVAKKVFDEDAIVLATNSFPQKETMTMQEQYIVNSVETAFALPIIAL